MNEPRRARHRRRPDARRPTATRSLPVDERVADLLGRMTIDEKLAQLGSAWVFQLAEPRRPRPGAGDAAARRRHRPRHPHQRREQPRRDAGRALLANEIQRYLVEHTRLGIPAIVHEEICSGLMAREATVFPQAIGVAARSGPSTTRRSPTPSAARCGRCGAHQGLSPVLDICRDPRWGRLEETYGEDPYLVGADGRGVRPRACRATTSRDGVVATAKHFVGYGASEGGLNWAPAHLPERELRDVYLRPFEAAVRDAGLALGDERLPRARRRAVRRQPLAADRPAARRVGLRRHRGVGLLLGAPARRVPPRRRPTAPTPRRPRCTPASTSSCPAPTATASRCATALDERRDRRSPTSTRRCAGCSTTKFRLGLFERPYVDDGPGGGPHPHRRPDRARPRRWRATASCCCATTACSRSSGDRRRSP